MGFVLCAVCCVHCAVCSVFWVQRAVCCAQYSVCCAVCQPRPLMFSSHPVLIVVTQGDSQSGCLCLTPLISVFLTHSSSSCLITLGLVLLSKSSCFSTLSWVLLSEPSCLSLPVSLLLTETDRDKNKHVSDDTVYQGLSKHQDMSSTP